MNAQTFKVPSRQVAVMWSLVFSYGTNALVIVRTLCLVPLYLQHISLKEYGAWLATGGVLSFLTVMDFGLMGVLAQQCAAAYGAGDRDKLGTIIGTGMTVSAVLSFLAMAVAAAAAPILPRAMGLSGEVASRISFCFVLAGIANGLSLLAFALSGVMKSLQRTFATGLVLFLAEIVNIALTLVLLLKGWGLYAIACGLFGRGIFVLVGNLGWCFLLFLRENLPWRLWVWEEAKAMWRMSVFTFAGRIASGLMAGADGFLIGALIGPETAGIYSLTTRAAVIVLSLAGSFATALMPSLAHLKAERGLDRFKEILIVCLKIQTTIVTIGMAGVIVFNQAFVSLWVGRHLFAGQWINALFCAWGVGYAVTGVNWNALYALGDMANLAKFSWVETILRLCVSVFLIWSVGVIGAPVAALLSQAVGPWLLLSRSLGRRISLKTIELRRLGLGLAGRLLLPISVAMALFWASGMARDWLAFVNQVVSYLLLITGATLLMDRRLVTSVIAPFRGKTSAIATCAGTK